MPLEAASFITQLVVTNPTGADKKSQGDDQLRLLKQVLINTFPTASKAFALAGWAEKEAEFVVETLDRTQVAADDGKMIYFDTSSGSKIYSLLNIASAPVGMTVFVDRDELAATVVTIDGSGAETINGEATKTLLPGESAILWRGATEWRMMYTRGNRIYTSLFHVRLAAAGEAMLLESTEAGVNSGPDFTLFRNSASPANDDFIGRVHFKGRNSTAEEVLYGGIYGKISDIIDGSEDGVVGIRSMRAGVLSDWAFARGALSHASLTTPIEDGAFNTTKYYLNNVPIANQTVQEISFQTQTADSTGSDIPSDASKPRWDEGKQFWSQAVTPKSATSKIVIEIQATLGAATTGNQLKVALFKTLTAFAAADVAVGVVSQECASNGANNLVLHWEEVAGSTDVRTYAARFGAETGTCHLNNTSAGETMNGVYVTHVTVREVLQ